MQAALALRFRAGHAGEGFKGHGQGQGGVSIGVTVWLVWRSGTFWQGCNRVTELLPLLPATELLEPLAGAPFQLLRFASQRLGLIAIQVFVDGSRCIAQAVGRVIAERLRQRCLQRLNVCC